MRGLIFYIIVTAIAFYASAKGNESEPQRIRSFAELKNRLDSFQQYSANVEYRILPPSADDEIVYLVMLYSTAANDTVSQCDYKISWRIGDAEEDIVVVSSDGNNKRSDSSNERTAERHLRNLLPTFIADEIATIATDSTFTYKFCDNATNNEFDVAAVRLEAVEMVRGYTSRQLTYIFDAISGEPLYLEIRRNPGSAAELLITAIYRPTNNPITNKLFP